MIYKHMFNLGLSLIDVCYRCGSLKSYGIPITTHVHEPSASFQDQITKLISKGLINYICKPIHNRWFPMHMYCISWHSLYRVIDFVVQLLVVFKRDFLL